MPHNVFISWSGSISKSVAAILHEWLPTAIHAADPFISQEDIEAGSRVLTEIATRLSTIRIGLICVTADNQSSAWLNYETGALAKTVDDGTRVIPLAFDIDKGQIRNPLGQFQAKQFVEEDMRNVVKTINRALEQPLTESRLDAAFELSWPMLITKIENFRSENSQQTFVEEEKRSAEDMLEELITASREHTAAINRIATKSRSTRPTEWSLQLGVTDVALKRLSEVYHPGGNMISVDDLMMLAPDFDDSDWAIVESAPFLNWYITQYRGIRRKIQTVGSNVSDMDDIPF